MIGAVSATAALAGGASATALSPSSTPAGTVRSAAPAVAPTATSQYTSVKLRLGARGSAVTYLQQRLNAHGASIRADGVFGSATLRAVKSFQSRSSLAADGVVGPLTWNALTGSSSTGTSVTSQPKLRQGDRGAAVRTLQAELNESGASLRVDGVFGSGTARSVRALQSSAGIGVDGVVGPKTWSALDRNVRIGSTSGSRDDDRDTTVDGQAIINAARSQIGVRYKWGGSSPSTGFDCSGLVYYAYNQAGIDLPRKTAKGYTFGGRIISQSEAKPGDLVAFTDNDYGHMGIYIGNGRIIDSSGSLQRVVERSIWNSPHVFVTYR